MPPMPPRRAVESFIRALLALLAFNAPGAANEVSTRPAAWDRGLTIPVAGKVVDDQGRAVAGAEVVTVSPSRTRVRTDAAGRFLLPAISECRELQLKASHRGFAPEFLAVTPCGTAAEVRLTLHSGTVAFGRVVDEAGRPVGGARVELFDHGPDNAWPYHCLSRADGSFEMPDLPAGAFDLRVWRRDFPLLTREKVEISSERRRNDLGRLVLPQGKPFKGQVVDPQGRPLAGAEVWVVYDHDPAIQGGAGGDAGLAPATVTGPDGGFEVPRFLPVTFVYLCRPGYETARAFGFGPSKEPRRIILTPAAPKSRLSGRVLDEARQPVAGARVDVTSNGLDERLWRPCLEKKPSARITDSQGRFAFELPSAAKPDLQVEAPGYLREPRVAIPMGRATGDVEIVLRRGAALAGQILAPDGSPVAYARVYATQDDSTPQTVTDAQGRYRLTALAPGGRDVWADHPVYGEARRRLDLVPGDNRLNLTLDGQKERAVAGHVVGPAGEPVAGALAEAGDLSGYSRDDGSFRLVFPRGSLLTHGTVEDLRLSREGYAPRTVSFKPAEMPIEDLEIQLEKGWGLTGHISGVEPEQVAGVMVSARQAGLWREGQVGPDGRYRIDDLGPGSWRIEARLAAHSVAKTVEIGKAETTLDLELPALNVRGRLLGLDGNPSSGSIDLRSDEGERYSAVASPEGTFALEIRPGTYTVSASAGQCADGRLKKRLTLLGPDEDLELRLEPGPVLRGRILGLPRGVDASHVSITISQKNAWVPVPLQPDGTYRCADLDPGEWTVEAWVSTDGLEASAESQITLPPGAAETIVDLDVSHGTLTLSGHLTSGDEPLFVEITLSRDGKVHASDVIDDREGGDFRFSALQAGTYLLRIKDYDRDRIVERSIDLTADETVTIDLLRRR